MGAAYRDGESQNSLSVLEVLVTNKADVNVQTQNFGETALMIASSRGYCQGVAYLLENGARSELCNKDSCTALIYAARAGRVDVIKRLISGSANIKAECSKHWRAVDWAHYHGHIYVVEYLLQADPKYRPKSDIANEVEMSRRREIEELLKRLEGPTAIERQPKMGGFMNWNGRKD